jgi:undecaprenyl diphosphate synthase
MTDLPSILPHHVAIIMDGNGRWATERGLPRIEGHRHGFESAREVARLCRDWGIPLLTLFAFSTENWKRPRREVDFLMSRLQEFLRKHRQELVENDVHVRVIGSQDGLPAGARRELARTVAATRDNSRYTLVLAINYGARHEIVEAARSIARMAAAGELRPEDVDEALFEGQLYTAGLPAPDLVIRTAGEMRLSNFLLWQLSYAELYVTDAWWPDFGEEEFLAALHAYARRCRRFGGLTRGPEEVAGRTGGPGR